MENPGSRRNPGKLPDGLRYFGGRQPGNRREWAVLGQRAPDGICLMPMATSGWPMPWRPSVLIAPGGEVLQVVATSQNCYACMLGGDDGRDLYRSPP